jgi:hypothetical protein
MSIMAAAVFDERYLSNRFDDEGEWIDSEEITQAMHHVDSSYFTKNRVVIEKVDPDMPNMEVVDLPGLQVSSQHPRTLERIRRITLEYLRLPNTFVVAVCPASSEPESQDVLNVIKDWDSTFSKTISKSGMKV